MAEQSAVNRCVVGSSPTSPANRDDRRETFPPFKLRSDSRGAVERHIKENG